MNNAVFYQKKKHVTYCYFADKIVPETLRIMLNNILTMLVTELFLKKNALVRVWKKDKNLYCAKNYRRQRGKQVN